MNTRTKRHKKEKGSALLVSLMVMVALSLLGLGFVAISETESAISVNERNHTQTLAVAEAGTRMVIEWFQNAEWAEKRGILPPNSTVLKTERKVTIGTGASSFAYTGYYKSGPGELLCDLPFKPAANNRFYGTEDSPDVWIKESDGGVEKTFLDRFNQILLNGTDQGGRITDIRLYAPPIVGGTLVTDAGTGNKFWQGGTRYGVATVRVTATKYGVGSNSNNSISQRIVKAVVSEFPFPGPEGPLQSNTGITTNGDFKVHWGKVTSQGDLDVKNPFTSIPWRSAWQMVHFEQGYEPVADATYGRAYPTDNTSSNIDLKYNWLYELLGETYEDPWFQARARANITSDSGSTANQPYPYASITDDPNNAGVAGYSNQFQNQDLNDESINKKEVIFPKIDYAFWKQIAMSGAAAGTDGIYYLTPNGTGATFTGKGQTKTFRQWVDTLTGAKAGFYFFDTIGGVNPQNSDGSTNTGVLTDALDVQGGDLHMRGFIYINFKAFGTKGLGGKDGYYRWPSEPYRDVGYRQVVEETNAAASPPQTKAKFATQLSGATTVLKPFVGVLNGAWDFQDLEWSNGAAAKNGEFDVYIKKFTVKKDSTNTDVDLFLPVPYTEGCTPGNNSCGTCNCSEPHEPYLNVIYIDSPVGASGKPNPIAVQWEDPGGTVTRKPKEFSDVANTTPEACPQNASQKNCTSNSYDTKGPLVKLSNKGPSLDGVLYNEGAYDSTGNAVYYGSVLIRGTVAKAGSVDIFYDESLSKGDWQKRFTDLPRVLITAMETDR